MLHIGCHLSPSNGLTKMGMTARDIGADTLQFFLRNPRGSRAKALDPDDAARLSALLAENAFAPILAHAPYTLNACALDARTAEFARICMADDLARLRHLAGNYYNFHPGSHVGQGSAAGIARTAALLNALLPEAGDTTVLLETMSGQGTEIGGTFEELQDILSAVERRDRVGVCLDTCHVFAAGYDIVRDLDGVLTAFDRIIGLDRLYAVHLNDSMQPLGSRRDRHQRIGQGEIGLAALTRIVRHEALRALPFILETPNDLPGYAAEIRLLRGAAG